MAVRGGYVDKEVRDYLNSITFWNIETAQKENTITLTGRRPEGLALQYAADGKSIVAADSDGLIRRWDLASGKQLSNFQLGVPIHSAVIAPDGRVYVAAYPGGIVAWNWTDGKEPLHFGGDCDQIALSRDGKRLAVWSISSANSGRKITILNSADGQQLSTLVPPQELLVLSAEFAPDGKTVLAVGRSGLLTKNAILEWETGTGQLLRRNDVTPFDAWKLIFSRDGKWMVAYAGGPGMQVWDFETRTLISKSLPAHEAAVAAIQTTPDSTRIVTTGRRGSVRIWDSQSGKQLSEFHHDDAQWLPGLAVSTDSRYVATSGLDDSVRIWDLQTNKQLHKLTGHGQRGGSRHVSFSADGRQLASVGDDSYVRFLDVTSGKTIWEFKLSDAFKPSDPFGGDPIKFGSLRLRDGNFAPGARWLAVPEKSGEKNGVRIFDFAHGLKFRTRTLEMSHWVSSVALSPSGEHLAVALITGETTKFPLKSGGGHVSGATNTQVRFLELATEKELWKLDVPNGLISPLVISSDGRFLGLTLRPNGIQIHRAATGEIVHRITDGTPIDPSCRPAFSHNLKLFVCGIRDATALVWDLDVP